MASHSPWKWDQIGVDFGGSTGFMKNALTGYSSAGTIFDDITKNLETERQNNIVNQQNQQKINLLQNADQREQAKWNQELLENKETATAFNYIMDNLKVDSRTGVSNFSNLLSEVNDTEGGLTTAKAAKAVMDSFKEQRTLDNSNKHHFDNKQIAWANHNLNREKFLYDQKQDEIRNKLDMAKLELEQDKVLAEKYGSGKGASGIITSDDIKYKDLNPESVNDVLTKANGLVTELSSYFASDNVIRAYGGAIPESVVKKYVLQKVNSAGVDSKLFKEGWFVNDVSKAFDDILQGNVNKDTTYFMRYNMDRAKNNANHITPEFIALYEKHVDANLISVTEEDRKVIETAKKAYGLTSKDIKELKNSFKSSSTSNNLSYTVDDGNPNTWDKEYTIDKNLITEDFWTTEAEKKTTAADNATKQWLEANKDWLMYSNYMNPEEIKEEWRARDNAIRLGTQEGAITAQDRVNKLKSLTKEQQKFLENYVKNREINPWARLFKGKLIPWEFEEQLTNLLYDNLGR